MVDDGDTPDDDSTFNSGAVLDDTELYTMADMTENFDTVHGIVVRNHYRSEEAGSRLVRAFIRSNVDQAEGDAFANATEYRYNDGVFEIDPQGSGAWTEARINALECGMTIEV
jgi:hypothetical protein